MLTKYIPTRILQSVAETYGAVRSESSRLK